jgi:hypothetical protein
MLAQRVYAMAIVIEVCRLRPLGPLFMADLVWAGFFRRKMVKYVYHKIAQQQNRKNSRAIKQISAV